MLRAGQAAKDLSRQATEDLRLGPHRGLAQFNDVVVKTPEDLDGISSLSWSPTANVLAASSWDNRVMVWKVQDDGTTSAMTSHSDHKGPVLCTTFSADGARLFSGGSDNALRMWDLGRALSSSTETAPAAAAAAAASASILGTHAKPIRTIKFCTGMNLVATGSWDSTLKYWDPRTEKASLSVDIPERVYAMDSIDNLMVVGMAGRIVHVYDLRKPKKTFKSETMALKNQIRSLACFPDKTGYAVGSVCGRVAISYVAPQEEKKNFIFKCHRIRQPKDKSRVEVYSVNSISFHPLGTFATGGSDGFITTWDKDSKQRLKKFGACPETISSCAFNKKGNMLAYALSYDWSRGMSAYENKTNKICLHLVVNSEVSPTPRRRY